MGVEVWGVDLAFVFSAGMGEDSKARDPILHLEQSFSLSSPCTAFLDILSSNCPICEILTLSICISDIVLPVDIQ